jgi:membrane-associated protease RseP (regulator of RpoE activity)
MDVYTLSVLVFFAILAILIYRDRKNVEIKYIVFMRRTKKGLKFLDKIAEHKKFWKIFGTIGVFVGLYLMINGMYILVQYGKLLITGQVKQPGLSFVLPSPTSQVISGKGYILLPFWFWIIIIASVIFPHELSHGIMSRVEKIRVKSVGFLLVAIFPGAFVEPDEKQLKKAKFWSKLRIFAVGSFSNFIVYLIVFGLISNVLWPTYVPGPIKINSVGNSTPAEIAGLKSGMVISEINGKKIKLDYTEYMAGQTVLSKELIKSKPGDEVSLVADGNSYNLTLAENPKNKTFPYVGITNYEYVVNGDPNFVFNVLFQLLSWMWILNYTIAIVNISPIYPLDGGLMVEAIAEKINKRYSKAITMVITMISLAIFLINTITPFLS